MLRQHKINTLRSIYNDFYEHLYTPFPSLRLKLNSPQQRNNADHWFLHRRNHNFHRTKFNSTEARLSVSKWKNKKELKIASYHLRTSLQIPSQSTTNRKPISLSFAYFNTKMVAAKGKESPRGRARVKVTRGSIG